VPRVAVILLDTNEGEHLMRTLQCLREQTRAPDRILVLDNASTDGSPTLIEQRFPEAELIRLGRNMGAAAANNVGARAAADCDWIALLNADAHPEPDWLEALLATAEQPKD